MGKVTLHTPSGKIRQSRFKKKLILRLSKIAHSTVNNFLSAETRKLKSKKEIIKMEEIKEKLRAFIQEKFEIDDDPDFTDDVHLFNEGFVDSFGAVEIIHFIEQTYNIEITQKDITLYPMNTIEEIAEVVENKLS